MDEAGGDAKEALLPVDGAGPRLEEFSTCKGSWEEGYAYDIKVVEGAEAMEVRRRFRDFMWLAEAASAAEGLSTLELPEREWIGLSHWTGPIGRLVAARQSAALRRYLEHLLGQMQSVRELPELEEFLGHKSLQHGRASTAASAFCAALRQGCKHQAGHSDSVNYVALSADMTLIVSVSEDRTARVWGLGTSGRWHCLQVLHGHTAGVDGVAIALDRSLIGTSGEDCTCRLWQASTLEDGTVEYRCSHVLEGHTEAVRFLAISRTDSFVATVSDDCTVRLWGPDEAGEWHCRDVLEGHKDAVYGVSIALDETFLATASDDRTCRIWAPDGEHWSCQQVLEGHEDGLYSANISDSGLLLATTSADCTCRLWERSGASWGLLQVLSDFPAAVYDVSIAHDESLIAAGDDSGGCHLFVKRSGSWERIQVCKLHKETIYGVQVGPGEVPGELTIGTGSGDKTSIIWRYDGRHAYKSTHIRPAGDAEVALPAVNLALYLMQNAALAFTPGHFASRGAVKGIKETLSITIISFQLSLPPAEQFFAKTFIALLAALCFLVCAAAGRCKALVFITSTSLVVPISRQFFTVFDCHQGMLEAVPGMQCYTGFHTVLAWLSGAIGLAYLALVVGPYTAAEGDMEVMPLHVWLQPREWFRRKKDKIVGLDLGLLSTSHKGGVLYAYVSVIARLLLLATSIFLDHRASLCCGLSLAIAGLTLAVVLVRPPMEHGSTNVVLTAGQALCANAFLAAALSALLDDPDALLPEAVLFLGWAAIVIFLYVGLKRHWGGE